MKAARLLEEVAGELRRSRLDEVEVFLKRGSSRRFELGPQGRLAQFNRERGWAVRAGGARASFFASGTGVPSPAGPWPDPDGLALQLPAAAAVEGWKLPADFDSPLMVEGEAIPLLEGFERELQRELPGSRLLRAVLEDGSSEAELASSRGVETSVVRRAATLHLEVAGPGDGQPVVALELAERQARRFNPLALARRLADRLLVRQRGRPVSRDRGEVLLAPPVAIAILSGLLPLLVGPEAAALVRRHRDRRGRLGSERLTIVDDGRLPGGVLEAPVDGEGVPTRKTVLVERGDFIQPLLGWREAGEAGAASGCCSRPSWRDVPTDGPTHLFIRPDAETPVAALVESVSRGYYLLDPLGPGRFDLESDRFTLPVCGFALLRGRATEPVSEVELRGGVSSLLRGIQAVGRDLSFLPLGGMLGSPTLLTAGLELGGG